MKNPNNPRDSPPDNWNLMMLTYVAAREYDTITTTKQNSKSPTCPSTKPRVSLSTPNRSNSKMMVLAEVAAMFALAREQEQEEEEEKTARLSVTVPRNKRSDRSRQRSTQWTTRVIEKQRSMELQNPNHPETCPSCYIAESKKRHVFREDEEERSLKKSRRFEVGSSSSSSSKLKEEELRVQQESPNLDRKKPRNVFPTQATHPPPPLPPPEWLVNVMMREGNGSYNPKLIIAKKLYQSDLDRVQGRLSMPLKQVVNSDLLTDEETRIIYEQSVLKSRREGVSVDLVDPLLNKHVVDLRKWKMSGSWNYVFVDGWNDVVANNTFRVHDVFHVWSFRSGTGKLCFALVPPTRSSGQCGGSTSAGESCH